MGSASALHAPHASKSAWDSHERAAAPSAERAMWFTLRPSKRIEASERLW
jgi:hypothetical protein